MELIMNNGEAIKTKDKKLDLVSKVDELVNTIKIPKVTGNSIGTKITVITPDVPLKTSSGIIKVESTLKKESQELLRNPCLVVAVATDITNNDHFTTKIKPGDFITFSHINRTLYVKEKTLNKYLGVSIIDYHAVDYHYSFIEDTAYVMELHKNIIKTRLSHIESQYNSLVKEDEKKAKEYIEIVQSEIDLLLQGYNCNLMNKIPY